MSPFCCTYALGYFPFWFHNMISQTTIVPNQFLPIINTSAIYVATCFHFEIITLKYYKYGMA